MVMYAANAGLISECKLPYSQSAEIIVCLIYQASDYYLTEFLFSVQLHNFQ